MSARSYEETTMRDNNQAREIFAGMGVIAVLLMTALFYVIRDRDKEIQAGMAATKEQIAEAASDACVKSEMLSVDPGEVITLGNLDRAKEKCEDGRRENERHLREQSIAKNQRSALNGAR